MILPVRVPVFPTLEPIFPAQTNPCFHPLASAETSPIPVSDCSHHEPSRILQHLSWLLDCDFLGTKNFPGIILLRVQLGFWATVSVARMPLTDILQARRGTCGVTLAWAALLNSHLLRAHWGFFFVLPKRRVPRCDTSKSAWLCEQWSHHQILSIDGQSV